MKLKKSQLKQIIKEEILTERLKRWKVYVSGESEPLILMGKNEREVKQTAYMMIKNSSVRVRKIVKEGKLNERLHVVDERYVGKYIIWVLQDGNKIRTAVLGKKGFDNFSSNDPDDLKKLWNLTKKFKGKPIPDIATEGKLKEAGFAGVQAGPKFSSPEAKKVVDGALKQYAKDLRKLQYRVVKDWMSKAKSGVIDFFDLVRGFEKGDISRAYPYETEFLQKVLTRDKIVDRFRKYFGGKKGKKR